jgi:hypothetical protein
MPSPGRIRLGRSLALPEISAPASTTATPPSAARHRGLETAPTREYAAGNRGLETAPTREYAAGHRGLETAPTEVIRIGRYAGRFPLRGGRSIPRTLILR